MNVQQGAPAAGRRDEDEDDDDGDVDDDDDETELADEEEQQQQQTSIEYESSSHCQYCRDIYSISIWVTLPFLLNIWYFVGEYRGFCVAHDVLCKNGWTNHETIWGTNSRGPTEPCVRWWGLDAPMDKGMAVRFCHKSLGHSFEFLLMFLSFSFGALD